MAYKNKNHTTFRFHGGTVAHTLSVPEGAEMTLAQLAAYAKENGAPDDAKVLGERVPVNANISYLTVRLVWLVKP